MPGKFIVYSFIFLLMGNILLVAQEKDIPENGYVEFFYPNGQKSSEGSMRDGKPDGFWKTYYVSGVLKSEGNRYNFLLDSTWVFYSNDGDLDEKIDYKLGKKNGYHITYQYKKDDPLKTPRIQSKELYVNGIKEGLSYYFYNDGSLHEVVSFTEGQREGIAKEFNRDSIIITLKDYHDGYLTEIEKINRTNSQGNPVGIWKDFFDNGKVSVEMNYRNGLLDGLYKIFNEKGNLVSSYVYRDGQLVEETEREENPIEIKEVRNEGGILISQGPYKDDIPVGTHRFYDANGNIVDGKVYDDKGNLLSKGIVDAEGKRQGPWIDYFLTGTVRAKGEYQNNLKIGNWKYYYRNGKMEQNGSYSNGRLSGQWVWYYDDGSLWKEEEYLNGKLEGYFTEYNHLGNIIAKGEYFDGEKEGPWEYHVGDHKEYGNYITGLRDGKWEYFYENGNLNFEGAYVQGNPDGKHKLYYPDETLKEERIYVMGFKEKNWKKYNNEGDLILTITYDNDQEVRINGQKIDLPRDTQLIR